MIRFACPFRANFSVRVKLRVLRTKTLPGKNVASLCVENV